jgi:hypothetical protein
VNRPVRLARLAVDLDALILDLECQPPEPDELLRIDVSWAHTQAVARELDRVLGEAAERSAHDRAPEVIELRRYEELRAA